MSSAHYALVPSTTGRAVLAIDGELPLLQTETRHQFKALEALKQSLGLDAAFLRLAARVQHEDGNVFAHQFDTPPDGWTPRPPAEWLPVEVVRAPPDLETAVEQWLDELRGGPVHPRRPPWARPGWLAEVSEWVGAKPKLVRQWPLSAVYRFDDDYFKAVFALFHAEPSVTAALAKEHPGDVPEVVKTDVDRGWILMRAAAGRPPRGRQALQGMHTTARVQRAWAGRGRELESFGCRHRPLEELKAEARQLAPLCDELAALGIPDTIVHGDLHQGNMLVVGERTVVIDWSDAAIGHPFLDLAPVLWIGEKQRDALAAAYVDEWAEFGTKEELLRAAAIGEALGCVYQAISYRAIGSAFEPADRWLFSESYDDWLERAADLGKALQPG